MKSGRGDESPLAAGGPARHVPVLREEVVAALDCKKGGFYLDATFGAGGYTRALLAEPETHVLAIDRDPEAIAAGRALEAESAGRLILAHGRFSTLADIAAAEGIPAFDGIVFDIGVSSMQLDQPERGFSFRGEGPLDMRMESRGPSAADLVNTADEQRLADIFYYFGEERASRRIARAIVTDRAHTPFTTTRQLAELIARVNPGKPGDIHPATRVFQALRIAVNEELLELVRALAAAEALLREGGRLVVVTFHSLEDRIVKQFLAARSGRGQAVSRPLPGEPALAPPTFILPGKQPVLPSPEEIAVNPRARSAKLRFGLRTAAPARGLESGLLPLATLPETSHPKSASHSKSRRR
ncbi:16S rRNA (cytosine(1402)-N(4))-methyltransferase RsmH [Beijerinckia indica]|uniref:Ribosomal RNA small subunit methyltransferase H n=1 Tax=Beijerinckia indica subsp. indica (strain ATCC 9039 / DSM 1715 / NCIMB 8712) TaxID=395963 RepID=RSMH_BEII9|nr:16S rRNA (cytosine(1402)-N(4))-methyltransferase RsmH [Beijerinckia indica]B2IGF2.1 RecName: Full=Ribosomal RNA small subunit methyltransferase H; AltName: Full=16S rRNA m(4)C1402 methyltransferase; AltName: Full=rRNA (cytosine-N(4)-)-methyltransferase RsmH [Beijerinckia indica subsp. indica ATCC 9039]ACB94334.1 S-adenosyl-methyltransferase MraW [Beijerinckia indica subsp. indica ATCC 9039]